MNLYESYDLFIKYQRLKGSSPKTIENYKGFLKNFLVKYGCVDLSELSYEILVGYIEELYSFKLSTATVATYLRHLRAFIKFIESNYQTKIFLDDSIFKTREKPLFSSVISIPKTHSRRVKILNPDEICIILSYIDSHYDFQLAMRNKIIIGLMLDCGLRQAEVTYLNMNDINFESNTIKVFGKGQKERFVPFGSSLKKLMIEYLDHRYTNTDKFIVDKLGDPITCNAIKLMVAKISTATGIAFSSHALRHNFATNYCIDAIRECGHCDIFKLQLILGHSDISTTLIYLHIASEITIAFNYKSHFDLMNISLDTPKRL